MNLPVADQPRPPEKPTASSRFVFATGDRPLSGYTIKRGLGRGGFGEVYFAVSDGGKEVALKLIRRNLDVELRGVQHCLNLKHPNLIALYDVRRDGEDDDCWIVMEYVAGESLEGAIRRHPQGMPADEAIDWLRGIAAGAAYLHSHGIVHRDLKPGNVFRDESLVKLGDYGLSKFISCSRRSGQTESVGTVHYMAPEIAHGRYGREIDIYALGVILYEMLTGRVPFDGESVGEVLMKHLTAQPDVSALPAAYRTVLARALAKDPAVRFSTIEQFLAALPGAGPMPAAAAADRAAAAPVEPEFDRGRKPAAERARPPARPAASDPVPPGGVLVLLGAVLVLLALSPALAFFSLSANPSYSGSRLVGIALFGGVVLFCFLARSQAPWKARQRLNREAGTAPEAPPPVDSARRDHRPESPPPDAKRPMPPAVAAVIGAIFAGLGLPMLRAFAGKGSGGPSSLLLIGLALLGGYAAYSWAKKRAPRRSDDGYGRTSDIPTARSPVAAGWPQPGLATATSAESPERPAAFNSAPHYSQRGDHDAASSPVQRAAGPHPGIVAVICLFLAFVLPRQLMAHTLIDRELMPVMLCVFLGLAVYFLFKWRARSLASTPPRPTSAQQPLPASGDLPRTAFQNAAFAAGQAVRWVTDGPMPAVLEKSPHERSIELLESLLLSAAVATVLAVLAVAWQGEESGPEAGAWFALSGTLGAWGVLILSKLWERTHGEPILRRFAMLVVGLGVGAASCGFDRLLIVQLPFQQSIRPAQWHVDWSFYNRLDGAPHLEAYLFYFGLLFFCVPWWRQADPLRRSRLRVGSLAWTLVVALLLNLVCPFPQPWGAMVAGIVSLAVQLASPPMAKPSRIAMSR